MRTLFSDRYAPITSSPGYLKLRLDDAVAALAAGYRADFGAQAVSVQELSRPFPDALEALQPITAGSRPRQMLVSTRGQWTAYFDCYVGGTDALSTVGWLTRQVPCEGLAIASAPHTVGRPDVPVVDGKRAERFGVVRFLMFSDALDGYFLNQKRDIAVTYGEPRWNFHLEGEEQPFEEPAAYMARRIRDRFTSPMLERYCQAIGVDAFNADFYGPRSILIETPDIRPSYLKSYTLGEVQLRFGIVPGQADAIPG